MSFYRENARHVVKFNDGTYVGPEMTYETRVLRQRDAQRFFTWTSAKAIADGYAKRTGARAVLLVRKKGSS